MAKILVEKRVFDDVYITDEILKYYENNGLNDLLNGENGWDLKHIRFSSLLECYLIHYEKAEVRRLLYDLLKNHISHSYYNEEILEIYSIARIYNINGKINVGYSYKNEAIISILQLVEELKGKREEPFFIVDKNKKNVNYAWFIIANIWNSMLSPIGFIEKAFSLCDYENIVKIANYIVNKCPKIVDEKHIKVPSQLIVWIMVFTPVLLLNDCFENTGIKNLASHLYFETSNDLMPHDNKPILTKEEKITIERLSLQLLRMQYLPEKCRNFYIIAESLMQKLDSSLFVDYSICSLQYYKIIEIEIKDLLIKPAIPKEVDDAFFQDIFNIIKLKCNKNNKVEWINRLTLDKIHYLAIWLVECFSNKEKYNLLANSTKTFIKQISEKISVISPFAYIIDCTHEEMLKLYRNPPAHTKPASRDNAIEAKEIMFGLLDQFYWCYYSKDKTMPLFGSFGFHEINQEPAKDSDDFIQKTLLYSRKTLDKKLKKELRFDMSPFISEIFDEKIQKK